MSCLFFAQSAQLAFVFADGLLRNYGDALGESESLVCARVLCVKPS